MKRLYLHMMQMSKRIWKFFYICMHVLSFCCIRIYQILRLMHAPHHQLYQATLVDKKKYFFEPIKTCLNLDFLFRLGMVLYTPDFINYKFTIAIHMRATHKSLVLLGF